MALETTQSSASQEATSVQTSMAELLEEIPAWGKRALIDDQVRVLARTQPYFPVIPVSDRCLLLVTGKPSEAEVVWLSCWFEVVFACHDRKGIHRVTLKINDAPIEVEYDTLHPKDIPKLSRYGLLFDFDYVDALSKYIFRVLTNTEVKDHSGGIGFLQEHGQLTFQAYGNDPPLLQWTEMPLAAYVEGLNQLLTNTAIMFALACSCATLFLAYLSIACGLPLQSFILSFYGKTTTGKSTAQTLMASVFTNPRDKTLYIPFFGTLNAIVRNFSQKFGVPQLFDEATVSAGLSIENLLYTITLEQDKNRCNTNAELREAATWKLIAVTSSEHRLLSDSHMHNRGLDGRLLSFALRFTDDSAHSDAIHDFCGKHYGILGKTLSVYLLGAQPDEIAKQYEACKDALRDHIAPADHFDLTERLLNEYALILLAARTLAMQGVRMDTEGIEEILIHNHNEIQETTNIAEKYYQHLLAYLAMHPFEAGIKLDEANHTAALLSYQNGGYLKAAIFDDIFIFGGIIYEYYQKRTEVI